MIRRPPRSTPFPTRRSSDLWDFSSRYADCDVPALHIGGWYDIFLRGTLANFVGLSHQDRKSTRLNSSHPSISYAVFCLKKKKKQFNFHNVLSFIQYFILVAF